MVGTISRSLKAVQYIVTEFRKKLIVEAVISVAVIATLMGGIGFFGSNIERSVRDIRNHRAELLGRWSSLSALATLLGEYNDKAREYLGVMGQIIPAQDQVFNLNKDFQALAKREGVTATFTFTGESSPSEGVLGSVRFQLVASGNFTGVVRFIRAVEQFRYLSRIDAMTVEGSGGRTNATIHGQVSFR